MTYSPTTGYNQARYEQPTRMDRLRNWYWRHHEHVVPMCVTGLFGAVMAGAFIVSLLINY